VDDDPGQISFGTFTPTYITQPGSQSVNPHLNGSTAISVRSIANNNNLDINNIFANIKPFNFGSITLTYITSSTTTSTTNNYTWSDITGTNMPFPITIFRSIPTNTITTYNMAVSFSNIKISVSSNIIDRIFNDSTIDSANQLISASNPGFTNPSPKWILGAWRTDMTGLPFTLENLRATNGNSAFQIGPGFITYTRPVSANIPSILFTINTNVANFGFRSITAFYPPGLNGTFGTFDCLNYPTDPITNLTVSGGALLNTPSSNNYSIACPYQYRGGSVTITISLDSNQNISNIS
jgi:hypothetical protein